MSQKTTVRKKTADKKTEAFENALNKTTDMLQEAINKVGKTSYQLNNPSTTTEFNPMEAIMKNGSKGSEMFGSSSSNNPMDMLKMFSNPPIIEESSVEDKLKNNPFSKIFAPENAGSIADILSSLSKMFSKKATNSGSLKLSGILNGSYIEMELTDKFTMMLARQIINKMITDVGKQV